MAENVKVSQETMHNLHLVQEFLDDVYGGKQQYRSRISFISGILADVMAEFITVSIRES